MPLSTRGVIFLLVGAGAVSAALGKDVASPLVASMKYTPSAKPFFGQCHFRVVNSSPKPILGFTLLATFVYSDGYKLSHPFVTDFASTLAIVGRVEPKRENGQVGVLRQGGHVDWDTSFGHLTSHGPLVESSVAVVVAVFDDNSVAGDASRAVTDFFRPHRVLATAYRAFLDSLRRTTDGPKPVASLHALQKEYTINCRGVFHLDSAPDTDARVTQEMCSRVSRELDVLLDRLPLEGPTDQSVTSYISSVAARQVAYQAHAAPASTPETKR
ncbi:hypothetical protein [uncultured Paludibaculum sp.]|uniref:hypothetical protein n=1 Tax=uncultured Paludibaculum sp. TaxID=1765020 RepID=UPI002AABC789|nr:hypothetical protein [uncultured Paludibaculum sp.]